MKQKNILNLIILLFSLNGFAQNQFEVFFDFNKSQINTIEKQKLENWIAQEKDIEVSKVYGYCDWIGTEYYNDTLSLRRVKEVYDFLLKNTIKVQENYEVKGFGENFEQSKVLFKNRKVTIFYHKKPAVNLETDTLQVIKTLSEKIKEAKVGDVVLLKNIYFKDRSARIVPESKPTLYELLCVMQDNPNLKIQIQGHICCQTVNDFEDISTIRAKAIYIYLIQNKINRKRLSYKGFGNFRPIHPIPEKNPQEEDENRRVEIMIIEN